MPMQFPSDRFPIPDAENLNVGEARDFLDGYEPKGPEDAELLVIAQGLAAVLHDKADRNQHGAFILLPEEIDRRNAGVDAWLSSPREDFPEE